MDIPTDGAEDSLSQTSDSTLVISGGEGYIDFRVGKYENHQFCLKIAFRGHTARVPRRYNIDFELKTIKLQ